MTATLDPYLFPELNGSQGITGVVAGWMTPVRNKWMEFH